MKKLNTYFCLLLLLIGSVQIDAREENLSVENYSQMSATELDAAFVLAVQNRNAEKMQELLEAGADVNTPIPYIWTDGDCDWEIESTALVYAVRKNCPDMVEVLVKVEKKLSEAFDMAIRKGYSSIVKVLIEGGADINYVDNNGNTPLIIAVVYQRRIITQALLEAGAKVSHANKNGRTALMEAVIHHDLNTVESLLQTSEINTGSFFGFGTKPVNYADQDGNTALILAIKHVRYRYSGNQEYNICLDSQKILNALFEIPGINTYHVNKKGETAITLLEKLQEEMSRYQY